MASLKEIFDNTATIIAGNLVFRILSLILVIYLARYLDVVEFGKYNFVFSYLEFFNILIDLGLSAILVREMSRNHDSMAKTVGNAHLIKMLLSLLAIFLSSFIIYLSNYSNDIKLYVYVVSLILLFRAFSDTYRNIFQTLFKMKYDVISKLSFKIIATVSILLIIYLGGNLFHILLIVVFSEMIKTILNYLFSRKLVKAKFDIDYKLWVYFFKESLPVALSGVFLIIYNRVDILMLSFMKGDFAVGIYSAAFKLSEPFGMISFALISSLFPLMSKYFIHSDRMFRKTFLMGLKYLTILLVPICLIVTIFSRNLILLVYSFSFADSAVSLQILTWATFFASINYFLSFLLISVNKQKISTLIMGVCVLLNVVLNLILIPRYSYVGASFATVVTEIVLFVLYFRSVLKIVDFVPAEVFFKPLVSALFMYAFILLSSYLYMVFYLQILLSICIYILVLIALKTFSSEEISLVKKYIIK